MKPLDLKLLCHTNNGTLTLSINSRVYHYWCDNAILLQLLKRWRQPKPLNKGKWLAELKRCSWKVEREK